MIKIYPEVKEEEIVHFKSGDLVVSSESGLCKGVLLVTGIFYPNFRFVSLHEDGSVGLERVARISSCKPWKGSVTITSK